MPMHLKPFRKWIRQIYLTPDEELDCEQFLDRIPQYVDLEVAGENADQQFPGVEQHLSQCAECYDLYLTLRDVAMLEQDETPRETADLQRS
jgi:predicted anti-sigma-YlaC factor YlaD